MMFKRFKLVRKMVFFHFNRIVNSCCDHRNSGWAAAAGAEQGKGKCKANRMHVKSETARNRICILSE